MSVKIFLPSKMEHLADNKEVVEVEGATVGDCIQHLIKQFPGIHKALFKKDGKLDSTVMIFINAENAFPDELLKPVKDGDEVYISGGAI
jgi:molybdopterin converting factor small subunit